MSKGTAAAGPGSRWPWCSSSPSTSLASTATLRSARLDLTEGKLYTLSEGSRRIAAKLDEPVHLRFYFSRGAGRPQIPRVQAPTASACASCSRSTRALRRQDRAGALDPEPFSEEEDARRRGRALVGAPLGADVLYFGLVGTNSTDEREVIPFFDPRRETFLEYDITRLIHKLGAPRQAAGRRADLAAARGRPGGTR